MIQKGSDCDGVSVEARHHPQQVGPLVQTHRNDFPLSRQQMCEVQSNICVSYQRTARRVLGLAGNRSSTVGWEVSGKAFLFTLRVVSSASRPQQQLSLQLTPLLIPQQMQSKSKILISNILRPTSLLLIKQCCFLYLQIPLLNYCKHLTQ